MSITKIVVFSSADYFGPDASPSDVASYNAWLAEKLAAEYPGADIDVLDESEIRFADVWSDGDLNVNDVDRESVKRFLSYCWEACPWDFDAQEASA